VLRLEPQHTARDGDRGEHGEAAAVSGDPGAH